ncbi:hypothetical protein L1887_58634 [Cichorium endivia]|nr:hypothetical protein L1887_58634 [Cichorium endivia]
MIKAARRVIDLVDSSDSDPEPKPAVTTPPLPTAAAQYDDDIVTPELPPARPQSSPTTLQLPSARLSSIDLVAEIKTEDDYDKVSVLSLPDSPVEEPPDPLANQRPLFDPEELRVQYDELTALLETEQHSGTEDDDEDYELRRQRKLRANEALLAQLGLSAGVSVSKIEGASIDDTQHSDGHDGSNNDVQADETPSRKRGRPKKRVRTEDRPDVHQLEAAPSKRKKHDRKVKFADDGTTKSAPLAGESFVLAYIDTPPAQRPSSNRIRLHPRRTRHPPRRPRPLERSRRGRASRRGRSMCSSRPIHWAATRQGATFRPWAGRNGRPNRTSCPTAPSCRPAISAGARRRTPRCDVTACATARSARSTSVADVSSCATISNSTQPTRRSAVPSAKATATARSACAERAALVTPVSARKKKVKKEASDVDTLATKSPRPRGRPRKSRALDHEEDKVLLELSSEVEPGELLSPLEIHALGVLALARHVLKLVAGATSRAAAPEAGGEADPPETKACRATGSAAEAGEAEAGVQLSRH